MKNGIFFVEFEKERGILTKLCLVGDREEANFLKEGRGLFEPHDVPFGVFKEKKWDTIEEKYDLLSFEEGRIMRYRDLLVGESR